MLHQTDLRAEWKSVVSHVLSDWLDIILAWLACRAGRWVAWLFPWAVGGAVAAEEAPAYNDETSSSPSNIQSTAEFIPGNDSHVTIRLVGTFRKRQERVGLFFTMPSNFTVTISLWAICHCVLMLYTIIILRQILHFLQWCWYFYISKGLVHVPALKISKYSVIIILLNNELKRRHLLTSWSSVWQSWPVWGARAKTNGC